MDKISISVLLLLATMSLSYAGPEVYPRICRADQPVDLTVQLSEMPKVGLDQLRLLYVREDGALLNSEPTGDLRRFEVLKPEYSTATITLKLNGVKLKGEAMHTFQIAVSNPSESQVIKWNNLGKVRVYTLKEDLFSLRPYRGDFHAHSKDSDGSGTSFSVYAYGRRAGNDFQALSDHYVHRNAVAAAKKVDSLNSGMLPIPAEEMHVRDTPLHSVVVDAQMGVCDWVKANDAEFQKIVSSKKAGIQSLKLTDYERNGVAKAEAMFDVAHKLKAKLVVYCHPYWMPNDRYNAPSEYNRVMLDRQKYDAVECPNGPFPDQAMMVYADKCRLALEGKKMNVVGASDTHGAQSDPFIDRGTIVFAPKLTVDDICNGVRNGMSLSVVGKYGEKPGETPLFIGDSRLVRYCYFLGLNYFPARTKLCAKQGELMLKALDGDESEETLEGIADLREKIAAYDSNVWVK